MISQLEQVYLRLQDYLLELEIRYIEPILSKPIPDKGDELDLRSYCVLSHAAFEEFAETVATYALEQIVTRFVSNQEICLGLCTILHFSSCCISASVAPFWAYNISKCSSQRAHHFISLRHFHLSSS